MDPDGHLILTAEQRRRGEGNPKITPIFADGKKFLMRFYAVRCGQMRRFQGLGGGKAGQETALEGEETAFGRVNTAYQGIRVVDGRVS